ncbi:hypothetical protein HELRODRAFT_182842 [Helobdella robusta]|uniref:Uncharacterized protein n=1 Tax=Helobdella robusta TaxID=6412 RepID=T1FIU6_HELRO|nr:hypothetical protein HELRODRAFT_182842 [Helobdella robusta]ESN90051.1 hypothetical protein HELRODRAFT_182842 [Helobdella robusta]
MKNKAERLTSVDFELIAIRIGVKFTSIENSGFWFNAMIDSGTEAYCNDQNIVKALNLTTLGRLKRSSMNLANRWVLRSALNFVSDGEVVRERGREFQRKGAEKASADLAKEFKPLGDT